MSGSPFASFSGNAKVSGGCDGTACTSPGSPGFTPGGTSTVTRYFWPGGSGHGGGGPGAPAAASTAANFA